MAQYTIFQHTNQHQRKQQVYEVRQQAGSESDPYNNHQSHVILTPLVVVMLLLLLVCLLLRLVACLRDLFALGGSRYSCRAPTLMLDAHMSTYIKVHIGTLTAHAVC